MSTPGGIVMVAIPPILLVGAALSGTDGSPLGVRRYAANPFWVRGRRTRGGGFPAPALID